MYVIILKYFYLLNAWTNIETCHVNWLWANNQGNKMYEPVIGMDAMKASHVWDHDMVGYGKVWLWKWYVPHKYPMNFLLLNNIWTTTFLLTLMDTT